MRACERAKEVVMLDGGSIEFDGALLAHWHDESWRELHRKLKDNHAQRNRLDARELGLLFDAEETGMYRRLGYPTMPAYMMAELDCTRHTANEKLRVARELIDLPLIQQELETGSLSWTKVRELTRVATPETEEQWLDAAEGKDSSQVQQMVKGFRKGTLPTDRPDPSIVLEWIGLELPPHIAGLWRQMRIALDDEAGKHLSDAEVAEIVAKRALMPQAIVDTPSKPAFQIAISTCRVCKRAQQVGPGVETELPPSAIERALCDADFVGDLEDDEPTRLKSAIPAPTRRKVFIRDRFACTVPGCTSRRFLEAHHIKPRAKGGSHEPWNLTLLCDGHHKLLHDGVIAIAGRAPDALVFGPVGDDRERELDRGRGP
jgi:hypothetical protein